MKTRELRIFRLVDGMRVPCVITLDNSMTVVDEMLDVVALDRIQFGRDETHRGKIVEWITEGQNNPIPGSDEVRAEFFARKRKIEEDTGGPCPPCRLAGLTAEFRRKLEADGLI